MSDLKLAKALLDAAYRDLRALGGMLDSDIFADEVFGFHVQQATEKSLKAWLSAIGDVFPYTHDLTLLLKRLENFGHNVERFRDLALFSSFAVQLRYEGLLSETEPIDRENTIANVEALYAYVIKVVSSRTPS